MITIRNKGVPLDALRKIKPTPPKNAGSRWQPLPHGKLIDTIHAKVASRKWKIRDQRYATARNGADLAGSLDIKIPKFSLDGMVPSLGFSHSNARRHALRFVVGGALTCCGNGVCLETITTGKHDQTICLAEEIETTLNQYRKTLNDIPETIGYLQNATLRPHQAEQAFVLAGQQKIVGWASIGRAYNEYHKPTCPKHGTNTQWALLNAFITTAKQHVHPTRQMDIFSAFYRILSETG